MAVFEVVEQQALKMIKATIQNETIMAEAGALHYMIGAVTLESKAPTAGGFLKSLVTQESIFRPTYQGTGEIYFGPPIFGEYMVIPLQGDSWVLDKGAYVCSDGKVEVGVFRNQAMTGFLGEGFFQTLISGHGQVVIQAPGPLQTIDLQNNRLVVDGNFAVARQAHLTYRIERASKSIIGSVTSGEGLVSVIEGTGRVLLAPVPNLYQNLLQRMAGFIPRSG